MNFNDGRLNGLGAGAVLVDQPWHFAVRSPKGDGRSASQHYSTMTLADIAALPIADCAAKDCWLFLWTTWAHMPIALRVMEAWGFKYSSSAFVWAKLNKVKPGFFTAMGLTTRKSTEPCLLGKRGHPPIRAHDVRELIVAPRREHSRKPDEQYGRIERLVDGPYIELFARQQWPGWICIGDEVRRFTPRMVGSS